MVTWTKFEKPLYEKNFFNKNGLKVGEREYIYIAEMKFEKKNHSV